jgi:hypothetical protein
MKKQKASFTPFRLALIARSNVGKTYCGSRYVLSLVKAGIFKPSRVVIMSKTYKSDSSIKELLDYCESKYENFKEKNCFEEINTNLINAIYQGNKRLKEAGKKVPHWLIWLDD